MENKSFPKTILEGKSCILDVLAVLQGGTKVNVEVQLTNEWNMDRRSLFYLSNVYLESLKAGQDYRELPNVIAVNLVLTNAIEIHFLNMVQWRKQKAWRRVSIGGLSKAWSRARLKLRGR